MESPSRDKPDSNCSNTEEDDCSPQWIGMLWHPSSFSVGVTSLRLGENWWSCQINFLTRPLNCCKKTRCIRSERYKRERGERSLCLEWRAINKLEMLLTIGMKTRRTNLLNEERRSLAVTLTKVATISRTLVEEVHFTKEVSSVKEETNSRALVEEDSDQTIEIPPASPSLRSEYLQQLILLSSS